jgi:hypothetical protein
MTWQSAKADAEARAALIRERLAAMQAPRGARVPLSFYPSPHDYRTLRPGEPWSWEHYAAVMRAIARILKRSGFKPDLVECTAVDCLAWLDERGLPSSPENRARYVAEITRS